MCLSEFVRIRMPSFDLPWPNGFCPAAQKDRRYILGLLHGMEVWSLAIPSTVGSQQALCIFGSFDDLFCPKWPRMHFYNMVYAAVSLFK